MPVQLPVNLGLLFLSKQVNFTQQLCRSASNNVTPAELLFYRGFASR
jgi:hypothetical protein